MEASPEKPEGSLRVARKKGGLITMPFIIANESFEKVAGYGLIANMILYLTHEYHFSVASGANILFLWNAASNFTPMLGAFLADSYFGRFRVIAVGSLISLAGILMLWCTAFFRDARPPHCDPLKEHCIPSTLAQRMLLYSAFTVMSIGAGGLRSCSIAFGADQFNNNPDQNQTEKKLTLQSFFNWYYVSIGISIMISVTVIVYIQDAKGWVVGFGVPLGLMFLAVVLFFMGSPYYVKVKGNKSLFTGFAQVIAASFKNRQLALPPKSCDGQYYQGEDKNVISASDKLRFINKACLIRSLEELDSNGLVVDPWRLCTVRKVEALKALIKVLPIWSTGIVVAVNINQTFPVVQASTMDRRFIGSFKIPAGSFGVFGLLTLTIWVAIYDRIVVPRLAKLTGRPRGLSLKQRMGIGLVISTMAMLVSALVERKRRAVAIHEGFANNPWGVTTMTAMWIVPQHCLLGLAEAFNAIGQVEFYYSQFPKDMSSIGVALVTLGICLGGLAGSLIVTIVDHVTKRGGKVSWVDSNANKGHYDYYYWVLSGLSLVNFLYYLGCSWAYGSCEDSKVWDDEDKEDDETDEKHKESPALFHV